MLDPKIELTYESHSFSPSFEMQVSTTITLLKLIFLACDKNVNVGK